MSLSACDGWQLHNNMRAHALLILLLVAIACPGCVGNIPTHPHPDVILAEAREAASVPISAPEGALFVVRIQSARQVTDGLVVFLDISCSAIELHSSYSFGPSASPKLVEMVSRELADEMQSGVSIESEQYMRARAPHSSARVAIDRPRIQPKSGRPWWSLYPFPATPSYHTLEDKTLPPVMIQDGRVLQPVLFQRSGSALGSEIQLDASGIERFLTEHHFARRHYPKHDSRFEPQLLRVHVDTTPMMITPGR